MSGVHSAPIWQFRLQIFIPPQYSPFMHSLSRALQQTLLQTRKRNSNESSFACIEL